MQIKIYRLFVPVAVWCTRRSDITLQREMNLAEGVPAPMTAEELRRLIDTGQAAPAERGSYCVQFGGGGHYFSDHRGALAYLCTRWGGEFIMRHLDDAVERAAHRRIIAIFEARLEAEKWQNRANPGGGDTQC